MFVSMVVNVSDGAVRFVQGVLSLDAVTVAVLMLFLVVLGVRVLHFVLELVLGMSLEMNVMVSVIFLKSSTSGNFVVHSRVG